MDGVTTPVKGGTDTATESILRSESHTSAEAMPRDDAVVFPSVVPTTPSRPEINSTLSSGSNDTNTSLSSIFSRQSNNSSSSVETSSTSPSADDACAANSKGNGSEQLYWRVLRSQNYHENINGVQRHSNQLPKGEAVNFWVTGLRNNSDSLFEFKAPDSPSSDKMARRKVKRGNVKTNNRKRGIDSRSKRLEISDEESNATHSCSETENVDKEEANDASYKPHTGKRTKSSPSRSSKAKTDSPSTTHPVQTSEDAHPQLSNANVATDPTVGPDFVTRETNSDTGAPEIVEPSQTSEKLASPIREESACQTSQNSEEPASPTSEGSASQTSQNSEESASQTSEEPVADTAKEGHIKFEQYKGIGSRSDIKIAILNVTLQEDKEQSLDKKKGFVYIYKLGSSEGHVKIGKSRQKHGERVKQWAKSCKLPFERISDPNDKMFLHYGIVEKLTHAELSDTRKTYKCEICNNKGRVHDEWFEVTEKRALEVIEKWRGWLVQQQPYELDGTLRGIWAWKRDKLSEANTDDFDHWTILTWSDWSGYALYRTDHYLGQELPAVLRSSLCINATLIFVTRLWCLSGAFLSSVFTIVILAMFLKYS
ncbi:hypothetical protein V496_08587 [Pseudogymnoascus sp. VKM F-4515 (FW-2607)]|nr:hypothetical protein V496_08587 [Pseudogymnoascus sp. VKM F-4515 (FW-2607)]KFY83143.1 hypothetical protein V498_08285 [Pseudogymnoascus sp. VKM F-4517 (FW-2822)]